jgi:hypothetical protein
MQISWSTAAGVLFVALSATVAPVAQVPRPIENVSGRVLIATSGQPLAGADVSLYSEEGGPKIMTAETDERGHFTLYEVPRGRYRLRASKGTHLGGWLGQQAGAGRFVYLDVPGPNTTGITLRLWPSAVIAGTVTNEKRDPVARATVRALRRTFLAGRPVWDSAGIARTDDRGVYRLIGLRAATYILSASEGQHGSLYFPNATGVASALPVAVNYGDERGDVDFSLPRLSGLSTVSGSIAGWRRRGTQVTLSALDASGQRLGLPVRQTITDASGQFVVADVPDGDYMLEMVAYPASVPVPGTVTALQGGNGRYVGGQGQESNSPLQTGSPMPVAPLPTQPTYWASTVIAVDRRARLPPVQLHPEVAPFIRGRVVFDGAGPPSPDLLATRAVRIYAADAHDLGTIQRGGIAADGSFRTIGLAPGRYLLAVAFEGWHQVSVEVGRDVVASDVIELGLGSGPVTLRFAKGDAPELSGTVRDEYGVTRGEATVYVFPTDRALWMDFGPFPTRLVKITTDRFGRYSVRLPPGSYNARAVIDEVEDRWMEPATLGRLATGATRIALRGEGGTTKDLAVK